VLGVDRRHCEELRWVWPTWMRFKPELREMPAVVFHDVTQVRADTLSFLREHPNVRLVPWELPNAWNQRERMLTGFVQVPAREVTTPWYLKLDTDVIATGPGEWIKPEWFEPDAAGETPVFISSKWGYTKPRYVMDLLDDWGDNIPLLAGKPRLNLPYSSKDKRLKHRRIISWLFFGRTDWTREIAALTPADGRLPYPSQDSFLFYCAARLGKRHVRVGMADYQWAHKRLRQIKQIATTLGASPAASASARKQERGVIYYNIGTSCCMRLLVSLASLRRHYSGPVTILSEGVESHRLCEKIAKATNADLKEWNCGVEPGANTHYLAKTRYHLGTPFEITVALDSDTLITGSLDELFDITFASSFCVARFADWKSSGNTIAKRIRAWTTVAPSDIEPALQFGPAINAGVIAFRHDATLLVEWHPFALRGRDFFIPDEVSCQILLHRHPHRVLDSKWNRSCKYDDPGAADTRIIHYHGRKHCRPGLPYSGARWVAEFDALVRENTAEVRQWMPAGDRMLRRHLRAMAVR